MKILCLLTCKLLKYLFCFVEMLCTNCVCKTFLHTIDLAKPESNNKLVSDSTDSTDFGSVLRYDKHPNGINKILLS